MLFGQSLGSDEHVNASGCGSEKDGSLSRRVAAADYDQVLALTHLRLDECRTVVHARTLKPQRLINRKPSILCAARHDDSSRSDMRAVVELDHVRSAVACKMRRGLCDDDPRPEFLCLRVGSVRELLSGNSGRKAEIILDFRTRPGLSAGRVRFRSSRRQALPTHRGRRLPGPMARRRLWRHHVFVSGRWRR